MPLKKKPKAMILRVASIRKIIDVATSIAYNAFLRVPSGSFKGDSSAN